MKHAFGAAALILVLSAGLTGPARAHAHLVSADPASGSTVQTSPSQLELHFSEALELAFSGLTLTGANQDAIPLGKESLDDGKVLVVPVTQPLPSGTYTVVWHVLSADGHKTSGQYEFTVEAK